MQDLANLSTWACMCTQCPYMRTSRKALAYCTCIYYRYHAITYKVDGMEFLEKSGPAGTQTQTFINCTTQADAPTTGVLEFMVV